LSLSSEITKTLAFSYRNVTMVKRNVFLLSEIFFWPFIGLLSMGFMLSYLKPGARDSAVVMSGVAAFSVLQTCQLDVAYVMLFDMWSKSMKHTVAAPIGKRHFLLGSWLIGIIRGTVTFFIITLFMHLIFKYDILKVGFAPTFTFLAGLMISGLIIGMFTTVALYTFGMRAEIVPWSIVSILLLVCGIYYPVDVLPPVLRHIGEAIPLTYFLEAYRGAYGVVASPYAALKGFVLSGIYISIVFWLLTQAERRARRRGLILKMSE